MEEIHRRELAMLLRTRRHKLRPPDAGLPDSGRRRTPGLRRQEVAQLAGISIDYYIRMEQGRGPRPSRQVLSSLGRALLLSADEREYLFRLVGEAPPASGGPSREVPRAVRYLLDTMEETPAYVLDAKYDLLAWNAMAAYFLGDLSTKEPHERNFIRNLFARPQLDSVLSDESHRRFAQGAVADLRAAMACYPGDRAIGELVTELLATSPRFEEMWAEHEVQVRRSMTKKLDHPQAGYLEFECQVLHLPDSDQRLVLYAAEPGSHTHTVFRELAARGAALA